MNYIDYLYNSVKSIQDFPKVGVLFRDVTSLCEDPKAFPIMCELMANEFKDRGITKVVGTEARGFVFGAAVAAKLNCGFVLVRKPGKLPRDAYQETYELEYGMDTLEMHMDALNENDCVLIVDDLIATGGTIEAAIKLVSKTKAEIVGCSFAIALPDLGGVELVEKKYSLPCVSVLTFPGH